MSNLIGEQDYMFLSEIEAIVPNNDEDINHFRFGRYEEMSDLCLTMVFRDVLNRLMLGGLEPEELVSFEEFYSGPVIGNVFRKYILKDCQVRRTNGVNRFCASVSIFQLEAEYSDNYTDWMTDQLLNNYEQFTATINQLAKE